MGLSEWYPELKGWTSAEKVQEAKPQIPNPETQVTPYLRAPLPLPMQYSPDTLRQHNRPGISSFRIAPLPPGGAPSLLSAAGTVSQTTINSFTTIAAAGLNGSIQFNNGGALGGTPLLNWDNINNILTIGGSVAITGTLVTQPTVYIRKLTSQSADLLQLVDTNGSTVLANIDVSGNIKGQVINAVTGFRVAGAATSGNILKGNGTNFVSSSSAGLASWNTVTKTSNYVAVAGDMVLADTSGGGFTVTLPASASNVNLSIRIKKTSSDTNVLTIGRTGSDLIDGQTTQTFSRQYTEMESVADGSTNWWIV